MWRRQGPGEPRPLALPAPACDRGEWVARPGKMLPVQRIRVSHFTDPGCPWAYSAAPALAALRWRFGDQLQWDLVTIGLTEDARQYADRGYTPQMMAAEYLTFRERWRMPFATAPKARVAATSRACRAIVVARGQDPALGDAA